MKWLGPCVNNPMPRQTPRTREPFLTDSTLVRLSSSVHAQVTVKFARPTKAAPALQAFVWLLACMTSTVDNQFTVRREPFLTHGTLVLFLAAVKLHVYAKMLRSTERFPTCRALKRLFPAVDFPMTYKLSVAGKALVTDRAFIGTFPGVSAGMDRQRTATLKVFPTLCTQMLALLYGKVISTSTNQLQRRSIHMLCLVPHQPKCNQCQSS